MEKVLELFCGTKSIGKAVKELYPNAEIISLDIEKKYQPTITCSLLDWDYKVYPQGHFDFIHASPPCTSFTWLTHRHRHGFEGDFKPKSDIGRIGDELVTRTLEIIDYFNPKMWTIENPRGRLQYMNHFKRPDIKMKTVYYCNYGFLYPKPTNIWSNKYLHFTGIKCNCKENGLLVNNKHQIRCQNSSYKNKISIPHSLCLEICSNINDSRKIILKKA